MKYGKELKLAFILHGVNIFLGFLTGIFLNALGLGYWTSPYGGSIVYGPPDMNLYIRETSLFAGFNLLMDFGAFFITIILFFCFFGTVI